jgi:hypothetical protein
MAIAPAVLRTVGEGDVMCAATGDAFRGVSMLIASVMGYHSLFYYYCKIAVAYLKYLLTNLKLLTNYKFRA